MLFGFLYCIFSYIFVAIHVVCKFWKAFDKNFGLMVDSAFHSGNSWSNVTCLLKFISAIFYVFQKHLWKHETCFLFHLNSSFILNISVFGNSPSSATFFHSKWKFKYGIIMTWNFLHELPNAPRYQYYLF